MADPSSSRRLDSLQILYWLTSPDDRVARFQKLFEEAAEEEREFLKALLFRAITERTVRWVDRKWRGVQVVDGSATVFKVNRA